MRSRGVVPLLSLLVFAAARANGDTVLVRDGGPAAAVVLAGQPTRSAQLAARELQEHIRLITGATLPIVAENAFQAGSATPVYVGESEATRRRGLRSDGFRTQEYLVRATGEEVILMGRDHADTGPISYEANGAWPGIDIHSPAFEVGTLYAVYDFLERICGVRWYLPTDLGTAYGKKASLACPPLDLSLIHI